MSSAYRVTRIDDLERVPLEAGIWRPIRRELGMTSVALNAYTGAKAGDEVIEPHDETSAGAGGHEELYLVVAGEATFEVGGESVDAPAGTMILIDVGTKREATAKADETTVLVIGGPPGAALPVSPFEHWYAAEPAYLAGDYERAYEVASAGLADYPDHPSLNYQLACYRALAGDTEGALRHFQTAATANPDVITWAADDEDLDSIRDLPGFPTA